MRVLAIDPGAATGWALFDAPAALRLAVLIACGLFERASSKTAPMPAVGHYGTSEPFAHVYCERPKYYPQSKVPARDLITLAIRAGECVGPYLNAGAEVTYYEPFEWKGSVDKNTHHPRLWAALATSERELVSTSLSGVAPSKRNNVMDAIGIGLFGLGRVSSAGTSTGPKKAVA